MELYILFVSIYGQVKVDNLCENLFWTPYNENKKVIELCEESVWKKTYPRAYKDDFNF